MSIRYRAVAFPFIHPGAEMLITAPESVHLQAITSKIENIYLNNRIPREMLASRGNTPRIQQRPTWNMTFMNGGSIKGRIPQRDGKGVKGMHPTWLEADEMQDFPEAGWVELSSTLAKVDGAAWRCHGVTRGVGGTFDKYCSPGSGWTVHRPFAPCEGGDGRPWHVSASSGRRPPAPATVPWNRAKTHGRRQGPVLGLARARVGL